MHAIHAPVQSLWTGSAAAHLDAEARQRVRALLDQFLSSTVLQAQAADSVGSVVGGPNEPLVFPEGGNGSSTQVGGATVLLSNSTFRCLKQADVDLLAATLGAGMERQGRQLSILWVALIATAAAGAPPPPAHSHAHAVRNCCCRAVCMHVVAVLAAC
jgi:hypothetical protein